MRILFISAKMYAVEPFGIMSLIPHLLRDGHEVRLTEAEDDRLFRRVAKYRPDTSATACAQALMGTIWN